MVLAALLFSWPVEAQHIIHGNIAADTTWEDHRATYVLTGTIELARNAALTIRPGVSVHFQPGARLLIYGRVEAERVLFDGREDTGNLETIAYRNGSTGLLRACILQDLELFIETSAVTVNRSLISNRNGSGITVSPGAAPLISHNVFQGNSFYALYKAGSPPLNAPDNYWGAADGPSGAGQGGGDAVNLSVDFVPFLKSDMGDPLFMADRQLDRTALTPGGFLTLTYVIDNLNSYSHIVILGASIYKDPTQHLHSQSYDRTVIVKPGRQRFTRPFAVPKQTPGGRYDVLWGIMKPDLSDYHVLQKDAAILRVEPETASPSTSETPSGGIAEDHFLRIPAKTGRESRDIQDE